MPTRRIDPRRVKLHRSYSVPELAACCKVHKNTIRHWQASGLKTVRTAVPEKLQNLNFTAILRRLRVSQNCVIFAFNNIRTRTRMMD